MPFQQSDFVPGFFGIQGPQASSSTQPSYPPPENTFSGPPVLLRTPLPPNVPPVMQQHNSRPVLSALHIPAHFSPNLRTMYSPASSDSGYYSSTSFQTPKLPRLLYPRLTPTSPLASRGTIPLPDPSTVPDLYHFPDSDDEDKDTMNDDDVNDLFDYDFDIHRSSSVPPEDMQALHPPFVSMTAPQTTTSFASIEIPTSSCPDIIVEWPQGSAGTTFPWHRVLDGHFQTESFRVEIDGKGIVHAFSRDCDRSATGPSGCSSCAKLPKRVEELHNLASNHKPHTNYRYLNFSPLVQLATEKDAELHRWRLKCANLLKRVGNCIRKVADYRRFSWAIAESNVPRLRELLSVGLRNGASPRKLTNILEDVFEGVLKYTPHPTVNQRSLDLAKIGYNLGGRKLLYAMSHGLGLPSLRTLKRHMAFTRIMPTIGNISVTDIIHNIEEVIMKPRTLAQQAQELCGVNLMIDEVALEERANAVALAKSIKDGKVHLAKEVPMVVAASCFGERGTYPILALPSCKQVNAEDSGTIFEVVTEAWNRAGAHVLGILWSWSTDGDHRRRGAGYKYFVSQELPKSHAIYGTVAGFCTLLRSAAGIALNKGRIITPTMTARFLNCLPGRTPDSVQALLFPDDPQDVPRAIELMRAVVDVAALPDSAFGTIDAAKRSDLDAFKLLGEVVKSLLDPFTRPEMSLTEQITSLSTFSHLSFAMYREARDHQTMVKNVMFSLVKQQALDPTKPFYIFQVGTDPLERLFGKLRMMGGHNSAMNYAQATPLLS
ncbi:hypothetical protein B0H14DRAFT_2605409 [Mycena olivaceomarginata]|nr:hypothetical protein B0H14DRAFT_2605409 [Mycena olivaceomarginata]